MPSVPFILGHEGCGIVEAVGDDVTEFKKGDRVAYMSQNVTLPFPLF